jgi:hypothetical protein
MGGLVGSPTLLTEEDNANKDNKGKADVVTLDATMKLTKKGEEATTASATPKPPLPTPPVPSLPPFTIPEDRTVAQKGMANLGNTCYANAVLQALAHAPELCLAIESMKMSSNSNPNHNNHNSHCHNHSTTCPKYKRSLVSSSSPCTSTGNGNGGTTPKTKSGGGRGSRSSTPPPASRGNHHNHNTSTMSITRSRKKTEKASLAMLEEEMGKHNGNQYCVLCQVEDIITNIHTAPIDVSASSVSISISEQQPNHKEGESTSIASAPIAHEPMQPPMPLSAIHTHSTVSPMTFIHGFTSHVAPWFRKGRQEDSHEFLRMLIDGMQKSYDVAAASAAAADGPASKDNKDKDTARWFQKHSTMVHSQ